MYLVHTAKFGCPIGACSELGEHSSPSPKVNARGSRLRLPAVGTAHVARLGAVTLQLIIGTEFHSG